MVGMLDVVANTEPGGFGGINQMLAQLRGESANFGGGVICEGDQCQPVDQFGNPTDDIIETGSGYWWPRVSITFIILAGLLTLAAMRFVVPAGMRWAFRRAGRRRLVAPAATAAPAGEGSPSITELREEPDA
jgi:hypothetical protein